MSQARRTRHFARSARRARISRRGDEEGWEKTIKRLLPVHCSGSSHVHYSNVELQLVNWWSFVLARFFSWFFDDDVRRKALRLSPNVPQIKPEKQKRCLNLLLKRKDVLGMLPTGFGKSLTNFFKLSVDMPNTTHKLVIMWKVTLEFVWKTGFQSLFLTAVFGHKLNFEQILFLPYWVLHYWMWFMPS